MFTIEPPPAFFIAAKAALQPRKVPIEFISLTRRYSSRLQSSIVLRTPMPAAFKRPCRAPKVSTVVATAFCQAGSSVTSRGTKIADGPSSLASAAPLAASRSASTALPPSRTTRRAVSAPMPDAPPLIRAILFSRRAKDPPPAQTTGETAVGHELRAGDEGVAVAGEPEDQLAELGRFGHVSDRITLTNKNLALFAADHLPQRIEDRGVDAAGMHRVAADTVLLLGAMQGHALGEEAHRTLAGGIGDRPGRADQGRDRRDVDDRTLGRGLCRS